jgi:hypothetical protein
MNGNPPHFSLVLQKTARVSTVCLGTKSSTAGVTRKESRRTRISEGPSPDAYLPLTPLPPQPKLTSNRRQPRFI